MKDQSGEESDVADSLSKKITETCSQCNMEIIDDFYKNISWSNWSRNLLEMCLKGNKEHLEI